MQHPSRLMPIRAMAWFILLVSLTTQVLGQTPTLPARTSCKQWDDTYLEYFNAFFWMILIGSCVLSLILPPLLGRFAWWATSPRWRIVWITLGMLVFGILIVVVWPQALGFGWLLYSGVGERYPDCTNVSQFGATGLLYGAVGTNIAAIALWPYMLLLFLVAALIGAVLAFVLSEVLLQRLGLYVRVKGAE
ncbi:MAG: hypothetical protein SF097_24395 [Acidobacteriota bacterium]|nr:hypothetical protein [Acidobacteriota bacterium]